MASKALVSVIVPTKNSGKTLGLCLDSIKCQTYSDIEIIVIDNNSNDNTKEIAGKYTNKVYNKGPERSAQRNYGFEKSTGDYVYFVDSDFILDKKVIEQCIKESKKGFDAIVVHNTPDETISWIAKIRKFEVDMYKYNLNHSAARFFMRKVFAKIGGYNPKITAGEDYDIQNKLNRGKYKTGFIKAEALHLGEPRHFWKHMLKYYEYGKDFKNYVSKNKKESKKQLSFIRSVYLKNWRKFVRHPILGISFIFYNISKYSFAGAGYAIGKMKKRK